MKLLKLTLIIFSLMAITALHSCKPEPPDPPPTDLGFFGLGEAKDYVYFKKGTWWVYQNTKTGLLDSIVVTYNLLDTLEQANNKWSFTNEVFSVRSKSLINGYEYKLIQKEQAVEVIDEPKNFILPTLERSNPYEGELEPFYYPFDFKNYKYCLGVNDSMIVNNKVYKEVAVFYIKRDNIEPHPLEGNAAKYYWARNYGLIRKDLFDSKFQGDTAMLFHSWQIINSHIIQ
jgi:hypothetical protein